MQEKKYGAVTEFQVTQHWLSESPGSESESWKNENSSSLRDLHGYYVTSLSRL